MMQPEVDVLFLVNPITGAQLPVADNEANNYEDTMYNYDEDGNKMGPKAPWIEQMVTVTMPTEPGSLRPNGAKPAGILGTQHAESDAERAARIAAEMPEPAKKGPGRPKKTDS